jgi:hypothetical protein
MSPLDYQPSMSIMSAGVKSVEYCVHIWCEDAFPCQLPDTLDYSLSALKLRPDNVHSSERGTTEMYVLLSKPRRKIRRKTIIIEKKRKWMT